MNAWFRRACDRAFNLGLSIGELTRRCHGETGNRQMVEAVLELEAILQADERREKAA
jgi:hypothetical protein